MATLPERQRAILKNLQASARNPEDWIEVAEGYSALAKEAVRTDPKMVFKLKRAEKNCRALARMKRHQCGESAR